MDEKYTNTSSISLGGRGGGVMPISSINDANSTSRELGVHGALARLAKITEDVEQTVTQLCDRLRPILNLNERGERAPMQPQPSTLPPAIGRSELDTMIGQHCMRLVTLLQMVREVVARLEI